MGGGKQQADRLLSLDFTLRRKGLLTPGRYAEQCIRCTAAPWRE